MQYRAGKGNPAYTRLHDGRNVLVQDASDGDDGKLDVMSLHLLCDVEITLQPQDRRQIFLGSGEAERTAADVVGSLTMKSLYIFEGVGCASYNSVSSQHITCFVHRHIVFAQVHAVGTSKALQMGEVEGAMSGLAVAVAGVMTAILCPIFSSLI